MSNNTDALTDRQRRELDYHRDHATKHAEILALPFSYEVLDHSARRWWNPYWQMYSFLDTCEIKNKRVLVVGCGFGDDAIRLAKLGAEVYAFDLSTESLDIARKLSERERLPVHFETMPAEKLSYENDFFDYVIARDILHHVDIPLAMQEIVRVSKPTALIVINEIYSHSFTNIIRRNPLVERYLYPMMQQVIYGKGRPYITEDERKLTELDIVAITMPMKPLIMEKYFNFLVTRIVSDRMGYLAKVDRLILFALKPLARFLGGRILLAGHVVK